MNKHLELFFNNTKELHVLLTIALLLIIIVMVAPFNLGIGQPIGQLVIVIILFYILFKNFIETHNFSLKQKQLKNAQMKSKKKGEKKMNNDEYLDAATMADMRNNTIASYLLCVFIFILLLYIIYSILF